MGNNYSFTAINPLQLAINLGAGYDKLVRYRPDDISKYIQDKDFIENYVNGPSGIQEGYMVSTLTGLPILNRYAEISYKNDNDPKFDEKILLQTILITVEKYKEITKSRIIGIDGTIKEFTTDGDYYITMVGTLASDNKWLYPDDEMGVLVELCNVKDAVSISNDYLNKIFQVSSVVIESFSLAQSDKFSNIVLYTLNCLSDRSENNIITK